MRNIRESPKAKIGLYLVDPKKMKKGWGLVHMSIVMLIMRTSFFIINPKVSYKDTIKVSLQVKGWVFRV